MAKPFRLGIIGAGRVTAGNHLPAAVASPRIEVTALVDPVVGRAGDLAERFKLDLQVARDVGQVLGSIDGVVIATPNNTHYALALACLEEGVPALIEKPIATSVAEGEAICKLAAARGVLVAVGYNTRFRDNVRQMARLLRSGYFGRVHRFAYQWGVVGGWASLSGFHLDRQSVGGGVLVTMGTHFLDRMIYWFGYPKEFELQDDSRGGPEANALAVFRYLSDEGPFEGTTRFSKTVKLNSGFVMQTDHGLVILQEGEDAPIRFQPTRAPETEALLRPMGAASTPRANASYLLQLEDFVEGCVTGREPMVSGWQGLESLRLVEGLYAHRSPMDMEWYGQPEEVAAS